MLEKNAIIVNTTDMGVGKGGSGNPGPPLDFEIFSTEVVF